MTLNIRLISANFTHALQVFTNEVKYYIIKPCYVTIKDPQNKLLYKTIQNTNNKNIQWSEQQIFCTNIQDYYQFQFYNKQIIGEDDYVAFAHFHFSEIEQPSKKLFKTIHINSKDTIQAGTFIIQVQYNQNPVKQTEPMAKRTSFADIINTITIQDMKQKWNQISLAANNAMPLIQKQQSNKLPSQLIKNVMDHRNSNPTEFPIAASGQKQEEVDYN